MVSFLGSQRKVKGKVIPSQSRKKAIDMKTMKILLEGLTLEKAPVSKAWSKVDHTIVRRAREAILLSFQVPKRIFIAVGKKCWRT